MGSLVPHSTGHAVRVQSYGTAVRVKCTIGTEPAGPRFVLTADALMHGASTNMTTSDLIYTAGAKNVSQLSTLVLYISQGQRLFVRVRLQCGARNRRDRDYLQ
jgi:hypothetical protein